MRYRIVFTDEAKKNLKKLDRQSASLIISWIEKNIEGCENPRAKGKALTANRKGQWRYRIGDYRLICQIEDDRLVILALSVGHRREIYS